MDTKLLKQKILDLAIRGKLIPQDPNDEPASVLLERIRAEREQLIKQGKLKRSKSTSDNQHYQNVPFEIPASWEWCTVDDIAQSNIGLTYDPSDICDNGVPVLRSNNIKNQKLCWDDVVRVKSAILEKQYLQDGDLLICARNGSRNLVGKCALINNLAEPVSFGAFMAVCRSNYNPWIYYILHTDYFNRYLDDSNSTAINQVTQKMLLAFPIPFPPLTEQKRIVAEVQRWFNIIEDLENNRQNLQVIIKHTKSRILDLAIHGKLVAQDPNDEPASELLRRIASHATPCDTSHYENLPQGWAVTSMHNLCRLTEGEKQDGIAHLYLDVKYLRGKSDGETMTSGKYVPANSTMILVDGENSGEIFTTPIEGYQGSTFKLLDISDEVYKPFILYVIRSYQKQFREHKVGSAIPHLNKKLFKEISVLIPPYEEQKRIVARIEDIFSSLQTISAEL